MSNANLAKATVAGGVFVLFALSAVAADWKLVAINDDVKVAMSVDLSSIKVTGNVRLAWIKTSYKLKTMRDGPTYTLEREAFNCGEETNRTVDGYSDAWKPVPPETMLDNVMKFVCKYKP